MKPDNKFPCTECGACCRSLKSLFGTGILPVSRDGVCDYLKDNTKCRRYATRPVFCNIEKMFDEKNAEQGGNLSRENHYYKTARLCNEMQEALGIDESFRIDLGQF